MFKNAIPTCIHWLFVQPCSFVFVFRCAKYFAGDLEWAFWCSCDRARRSIISSTGLHIEMKYLTFQDCFKPCLHISAMRVILSHVDALHGVSPSEEFAGTGALLFTTVVMHGLCDITDHTYSQRTITVNRDPESGSDNGEFMDPEQESEYIQVRFERICMHPCSLTIYCTQ